MGKCNFMASRVGGMPFYCFFLFDKISKNLVKNHTWHAKHENETCQIDKKLVLHKKLKVAIVAS